MGGITSMANKQAAKSRASWEVDFLYVELDSQQKRAVQDWDLDLTQTLHALSGLLLGGCKVSIVHDARNDTFIGSATSAKVEGGGRQVCLSARGPDMTAVLRVLAYKIVMILDGDMQNAREIAEARSQWG